MNAPPRTPRWRSAIRAAAWHVAGCLIVTLLAMVLVFAYWYPHPYDKLSGGRELFELVVAVDIVCGPLLTLAVFNPAKSVRELTRDLTVIVLV